MRRRWRAGTPWRRWRCGPMCWQSARVRTQKLSWRFVSMPLASARAIVERTRTNPYRVKHEGKGLCLGLEWRCGLLRHGPASRQRAPSRQSFVDASRDNLHYLLGRNTFRSPGSRSWANTRSNTRTTGPRARVSRAARAGLLSGGPNAGRQDAVLATLPKDLPPAKVYADQLASYASNEIAINWQASLVFLLAGQLQ